LYFWDPVRKAAGLSHAGWKGSVLQIAEETVAQMRRLYGTAAKDLKAAIGPSIGMCCYEVDDTVIRQVENALKELGQVGIANREAVYRNAGNGKYMLSLQQLNRQIMIKAGIPVSNIEVTSLCTSCLTDTFYSHRKEGGKTGRMAAWIGIHA
jgi:YfiH family protein